MQSSASSFDQSCEASCSPHVWYRPDSCFFNVPVFSVLALHRSHGINGERSHRWNHKETLGNYSIAGFLFELLMLLCSVCVPSIPSVLSYKVLFGQVSVKAFRFHVKLNYEMLAIRVNIWSTEANLAQQLSSRINSPWGNVFVFVWEVDTSCCLSILGSLGTMWCHVWFMFVYMRPTLIF